MGLIPARAGNTGAPVVAGWFGWAHPRSRGEHTSPLIVISREPGSSPLARGTPSLFFPARPFFGLIPARAGNTCSSWRVSPPTWAHPRSRGEHSRVISGKLLNPGSSPLARGTPANKRLEVASHGLIPARAGNTADSPPSHPAPWAHPRSRGEHLPFGCF